MRTDPFGVKHRFATPVVVAVWLAASSTVSLTAHAAVIHKCAGRSGVAYQTAPCTAGERELAVLAPLSTSGVPDAPIARAAADEPLQHLAPGATALVVDARWLPYRRRMIAVGMTDDEVLNAPNGGVPGRIERTRDGRTWRELWVYQTRGGGERALQFINGRLTGIIDDETQEDSLRLALSGGR
jgi:hypothetical protein